MARPKQQSTAPWRRLVSALRAAGFLGVATLTIVLLVSLLARLPAPAPDAAVTPPPLQPERIRVDVRNGCGVPGAARAAASLLQGRHGIDVVDVGNARATGLERTVVLDRGAPVGVAQVVADCLEVEHVILQRSGDEAVDVTVVVGFDRGRWDDRGLLRGGRVRSGSHGGSGGS